MQFQSFASGSSGNCHFVASEATKLLVDAGISRKRTSEALAERGLTLADIDGILITHEHSDHILGLAMLEKATDIPIYASAGTIRALRRMPPLAHIPEERFHPVKADEAFVVKDVSVMPFAISHDAAEPLAFSVRFGGQKVSVCTDLGVYTAYTAEHLRHSDVMLLEANHDIRMLQMGRYPYPLKQRILGERGHLSNDASAKLLLEVLNSHLQAVFLGHLSQENNLPELAYETVRLELKASGDKEAAKLPLYVAERTAPSRYIDF